MNNAFSKQIGGNHYVTMRIQPIYFATVNRYDPALFATLEYLIRHKHKNGAEDLEKAIHSIELREDMIADMGFYTRPIQSMTMQQFLGVNAIEGPLSQILRDFEGYAAALVMPEVLITKMRAYMENEYGCKETVELQT